MKEYAKKGDTVRVHYTGRLESGEVFDFSQPDDPLEFKIGSGEVLPLFDEGVVGMQVGEKRRIEIDVDDAYGPRAEHLVHSISRAGINLQGQPHVGMSLSMHLPDGVQLPVTVTELTETHITLDANHPLAGKKLIFEVERVE